MEHFHCIVVGGGPAGSTIASLLSKSGLRVAMVLESKTRRRVGETLPPEANPILKQIGFEDIVREGAHIPCLGNTSLWGSTSPTTNDFIFNPYSHGWHLNRQRFDDDLALKAREDGVYVLDRARMKSFSSRRSGWQVEVHSSQEQNVFDCNWLVDATGRSRYVSRTLMVPVANLDRLVSLTAVFSGDDHMSDSNGHTLLEARPDGWWYSCLLSKNERVFSWFSDAASGKSQRMMNPVVFEEQLTGSRLMSKLIRDFGYTCKLEPIARNASISRLTRFSGKHWLAVGDSAFTRDPLSSQGILGAIKMAIAGANAIVADVKGCSSAETNYKKTIAAEFNDHLHQRKFYYSLVREWRDHPFWVERNQQDRA